MKAETVKLTMIAAQLALSTNLAKTEIKSWQSRGLSSEGGGRRSSFPPFYCPRTCKSAGQSRNSAAPKGGTNAANRYRHHDQQSDNRPPR